MNGRAALLALAVTLAFGCSSPPPANPRQVTASRPPASEAVAAGESLFARGEYEAARRAFESAVEENRDDPRAWLDLGLALEQAKEWAVAEQAYRRAVELDENFAQALNNLGVLVRDRGALPEAQRFLEQAVSADPGLGHAHFNLALAYEDQGKLDEAEASYLRAIELVPTDAISRINLGLLYVERGRTEAAAKQLRLAVPLAQSDPALSLAIGAGLRRLGQASEAVSVLEHARTLTGDRPPPQLSAELALALWMADRLEEAERSMRDAVSQAPEEPAFQYALASLLVDVGKPVEASTLLKRTIELDPNGYYADRARARLRQLEP